MSQVAPLPGQDPGSAAATCRTSHRPKVYFRYVDDTFCVFTHESEVDHFFSLLNGVHPALKFMVDKEVNGSLPFLDVLVHRTPSFFITSVYRKSNFTGLYTRWDSFCPKRQKINLTRTLTK